MDFLKAILGDELFAQVSEKINAYNGNEANKAHPVKVANLGGGEYVGRAKYDALQALLDGKSAELDTANGLIADFKKSEKGNEALQGKITAYEGQIAQLQDQLAQARVESEIKVALLGAKAMDVDYLTFKLKEKGDKLELGEDGKIRGIDELISGLKTQFPHQFEKANGGMSIEANPLPVSDPRPTVTKEQFDRMGYQSRLKLKQESPETYARLTGKANN